MVRSDGGRVSTNNGVGSVVALPATKKYFYVAMAKTKHRIVPRPKNDITASGNEASMQRIVR